MRGLNPRMMDARRGSSYQHCCGFPGNRRGVCAPQQLAVLSRCSCLTSAVTDFLLLLLLTLLLFLLLLLLLVFLLLLLLLLFLLLVSFHLRLAVVFLIFIILSLLLGAGCLKQIFRGSAAPTVRIGSKVVLDVPA